MGEMLDLWQERAAIMEFEAGLSRFEAETRAAECYGTTRHQMMKDLRDEDGRGFAGGHGHQARPLDGKRDAGAVPGLQSIAAEEDGPVPECEPEAGRFGLALLPLRFCRRRVLQ